MPYLLGNMARKIDQNDLDAFRRMSLGQPLLEVAKDFHKRALARFSDYGHSGLQRSHQAVFLYLEPSGARLTSLAGRASMTKQAMGQLVDEVERLGYVERRSDPTDGRAKIVCFTDAGREVVRAGTEIAREIQEEYASLIGRHDLRTLHDILGNLVGSMKERRLS